tara:strand:+ start:7534 stop:7758 length:225 start_codon:yes stop_codon:yes gene_type:complete
MNKEMIVDMDFLQAFNLGYELAKELNLTSPMFKDLNSGNSRMSAIQAGMAEYNKEITQKMDKSKNKDKGFNLSI